MAEDNGLYELKNDLRMSMIIAAFTGISWFIGAEINTSLFLVFKRRRGLYFWSAALASWGVVLQPLFIVLADFGIWTDLKGSITMIYLTWFIMVVPQSWLLYSRLHLMASHATMLRWIKFILIFTSIVFSVPTIIMGTIAVSIIPILSRPPHSLRGCCLLTRRNYSKRQTSAPVYSKST